MFGEVKSFFMRLVQRRMTSVSALKDNEAERKPTRRKQNARQLITSIVPKSDHEKSKPRRRRNVSFLKALDLMIMFGEESSVLHSEIIWEI